MAAPKAGKGGKGKGAKEDGSDPGGSTTDHVKVFLGEFRIILPGLGALLGFQLTTAFQQSFERMSELDKVANFAGLACTGLALLFLLVPASYHRFTARQEESEEFLRFARRSVHAAFVFMPLGISLALYLQGVRTFETRASAAAVAFVAFLVFVAFWWVVPWSRASRKGRLPSDRAGGRASKE